MKTDQIGSLLMNDISALKLILLLIILSILWKKK